MSLDAELHLKSDHIRAVKRVDFATDQSGEANVSIKPAEASVDVGGTNPAKTGTVSVTDSSGADVGTLSGDDEAGTLELRDSNSLSFVKLDAAANNQTSEIEVLRGGDVRTRVENTRHGGRIAVRNSLQSAPGVDMRAARNGGDVRVTNETGSVAGRLRGEDASLFLNHDQASGLDAAGGGELVVGNLNSPRDVHVHATGKFQSDYGIGQGHRPRILLKGPEATMALGRGEQDSGASAKRGQVLIRDDRGDKLLELRATQDSRSEVVFRWSDGGTPVRRGTVTAVEDGLMFEDSNGDDALLIANNGEIRTAASSIDEGAL
jgi:formylmethanofuran dehydrogenase subunit C